MIEENSRKLLIRQVAYDFEYLILEKVGGTWADKGEDLNQRDGKPKHVYQFSELHFEYARGLLGEEERTNYETVLAAIFSQPKSFRAASTNLRDELTRMKNERLGDAHPDYNYDVMLRCGARSEVQRKMLDYVITSNST